MSNQDQCTHRLIRHMKWPDNGMSELCMGCLFTRHNTEMETTEWQNHGYKKASDWYREAYELQFGIDEVAEKMELPWAKKT